MIIADPITSYAVMTGVYLQMSGIATCETPLRGNLSGALRACSLVGLYDSK